MWEEQACFPSWYASELLLSRKVWDKQAKRAVANTKIKYCHNSPERS